MKPRPAFPLPLRPTLTLRPNLLLPRHHSLSTTSHPPHKVVHDELTFSPSEMLRTIKRMQGQDDDKGSRRLDFISYSKSTSHPDPTTPPMTTTTSTPPTSTSTSPIKLTPSNLSKAELCARYSIHPRNLGIIDMAQSLPIGHYQYLTTSQPKTSSAEAVIVPLGEVILVNLLYVKALITSSQVLLFSPVPSSGGGGGGGSSAGPIQSPLQSRPQDQNQDRSPTSINSETVGSTSSNVNVSTSAIATAKTSDPPLIHLALQPGSHLDPIDSSSPSLGGGHEGIGDVGSEEVLFDIFGKYLEQRLSRDSVDPFEHRALESLLTSLASIFEAELALLVSRTDALVHDLAEDITREELNRLLGLRGAVGECLGRTVGIRRAVDRLLSEDADLAAAYLTAKATNTPRTTADHEELELLLENYSQRFEGIITGVNGALARIKSNQDVVELSLASTRNKLLLLDLKMSLCTVGLTLGAFGAGLLGMNLTNHFEDDPTAFYEVSAGLILLTSVVGGLGIRALRRISRAGLGSLARIATRR